MELNALPGKTMARSSGQDKANGSKDSRLVGRGSLGRVSFAGCGWVMGKDCL